jgi:hypothetical protein
MADGTAVTWQREAFGAPYVITAWYGGHDNYNLTDVEAALLVAAGYTIVDAVAPAVPAPVITNLTPASGIANTLVTVTGTDLTAVSSVTVGGTSVSFTSLSSTTLTFVTPTHADGAVDVIVVTATGSDVETFTYSAPAVDSPPVITALAPTSGVAGATVTITGTDLGSLTAVTFDGTNAQSFTSNSETSATAVAPDHADGAINVVATDANGSSAPFSWTYDTPDAPDITSFTPSSGVAGVLVTVTGTTLQYTTDVSVDGVSTGFTLGSATSLTFTAPTHADGTINVVVTSPYGTGTKTWTYFTPVVSSPPDVTGITPNTGVGGVTVVFAGSSFAGATAVSFGGTPATSFTVNSGSQITATAPAHADGAVTVTVTTGFGSDTITFTYVTPSSDPHPGADILLEDGTYLLLEDGSSSLLQET